MNRRQLNLLLKSMVICGNTIFIFWGMFNGVNEGFNGTIAERYAFLGLISLLSLNCFMLLAEKSSELIIIKK